MDEGVDGWMDGPFLTSYSPHVLTFSITSIAFAYLAQTMF